MRAAIAERIYASGRDPLRAPSVLHALRERFTQVSSSTPLRWDLVSDETLYWSKLGVLGRATCRQVVANALSDLKRPDAPPIAPRVRSAIDFNARRCGYPPNAGAP
jgi:hypothetical protein